jgi:hypothetical protein
LGRRCRRSLSLLFVWSHRCDPRLANIRRDAGDPLQGPVAVVGLGVWTSPRQPSQRPNAIARLVSLARTTRSTIWKSSASSNENLTPAQKTLLFDHQRLGHLNMGTGTGSLPFKGCHVRIRWLLQGRRGMPQPKTLPVQELVRSLFTSPAKPLKPSDARPVQRTRSRTVNVRTFFRQTFYNRATKSLWTSTNLLFVAVSRTPVAVNIVTNSTVAERFLWTLLVD